MKKVFVKEEWCLGCHLCEYNCAFANSGLDRMEKLKGKSIYPRIRVESGKDVTYAVSCRHCKDAICVKSCISGALHLENGAVCIDREKCVGCLTCVLVCPFGAVVPGENGAVQKCELCLKNSCGEPACVSGCPNRAIVYEEG